MEHSIGIITKQWFNMFMLCMKSSKKQIKKFATDYRDLFQHWWTHVIMHKNIYHQNAMACAGTTYKRTTKLNWKKKMWEMWKRILSERSKLNGYNASVHNDLTISIKFFAFSQVLVKFTVIFITLASAGDNKIFTVVLSKYRAQLKCKITVFIRIWFIYISCSLCILVSVFINELNYIRAACCW